MTDIAQDHLAHVEAALREHRELEKRTESLLTLSEAWGQDRPDRSALLRGARILSRIAHDLVCHFIWEECDGYMGAVLRHDPSRYDEVDRMRRDHERMNHTMKSIHDDAVLAGYGGRTTEHDGVDRRRRCGRPTSSHGGAHPVAPGSRGTGASSDPGVPLRQGLHRALTGLPVLPPNGSPLRRRVRYKS